MKKILLNFNFKKIKVKMIKNSMIIYKEVKLKLLNQIIRFYPNIKIILKYKKVSKFIY